MNGKNYHIYIYILYLGVSHFSRYTPKISFRAGFLDPAKSVQRGAIVPPGSDRNGHAKSQKKMVRILTYFWYVLQNTSLVLNTKIITSLVNINIRHLMVRIAIPKY